MDITEKSHRAEQKKIPGEKGSKSLKKGRFFVIAAVLAVVVALGIVLNSFKTVTQGSVKRELERLCSAVEKNPSAFETQNSALSGVLYDELAQKLASRDYIFYLFASDSSVVQKYPADEGTYYIFKLSGEEYGSLSGQTYIYYGSSLYLSGQEGKRYDGEEKNDLLDRLLNYIPEGFFGRHSFDRLLATADKNSLEMSEVFYGDGVKAFINDNVFLEQWEDGICKISFEKHPPIAELTEKDEGGEG